MCSGYLAERHQESPEVSRGVAADGVLQLFPIFWKCCVKRKKKKEKRKKSFIRILQ